MISTCSVGLQVGKKKPEAAPDPSNSPAPATRQVAFRLPTDLHKRIEHCADALGLDFSNLLRMLVVENLPQYEERADAIRDTRKPKPDGK